MKKISIITAFIILSNSSFAMTDVHIHAGFWGWLFGGYSDVYSSTYHDTGMIEVNCRGIGSLECVFSHISSDGSVSGIKGISGNVIDNQIKTLIQSNISSSNLSGTTIIDGRNVTWNISAESDIIDIVVN
jgi:hypothetical protein